MSKQSFDTYIRDTHSTEIQKIRGRKGGVIGGRIGKGGGRPKGSKVEGSLSNEKPWLGFGISRATWYRKKKKDSHVK